MCCNKVILNCILLIIDDCVNELLLIFGASRPWIVYDIIRNH